MLLDQGMGQGEGMYSISIKELGKCHRAAAPAALCLHLGPLGVGVHIFGQSAWRRTHRRWVCELCSTVV